MIDNYTGSHVEALDVIRAIGVRDRLIAQLESALREAIELIEGTGLDATVQREAIQKLEAAR